MLWIQYEASGPVNPESIKAILKCISEIIEPFPVAAFDTGPFGIGVMVYGLSEPEDSNETEDSLIEPENEHTDDNGVNDPGGNGPRPPNDNHHEPGGNDKDHGDQGDENDDNGQGATQTSSRICRSRQAPIFTGEVTIRCDQSHTQRLKTSFGLAISPSAAYTGPNFQVRLDSIVIVASAMSRNDETAPPFAEEMTPLYVIDNIRIVVAPSEGHVAAPVARPQKRHFIRSVSTSRQTQWSVAITASAAPAGTLGIGGQNSTSIEHNPIVIGIVPEHIGGGARNDFEWRYKVLGDSDTHVEMSSRNPPVHEATYILYSSPPSLVDVSVETVFRRKRRIVPIERSPFRAYFRVFQDVQVMHLRTRLDVKIPSSEGRGGFVFPVNDERGTYLKIVAEIEGRKRLEERFETSPTSPDSPETMLNIG
jgi:hypothetical protein